MCAAQRAVGAWWVVKGAPKRIRMVKRGAVERKVRVRARRDVWFYLVHR